jgi:hypothetical protein
VSGRDESCLRRGGVLDESLVDARAFLDHPESAVTAMRALIERDGVLAVVGPITSRNLNAIAPVAESLKTPLLYATNYEGGKCSRYFFSFSTVPNQETHGRDLVAVRALGEIAPVRGCKLADR